MIEPPNANPLTEIEPRRLQERLAGDRPPRVIDIREPHEWSIARIEGAETRAMSTIDSWWQALDPAEEVVFVCHHGVRSAAVCRALENVGFKAVVNLRGGIEAWRSEVDPTMRGY